jgi:thiol-disulfide isomerase/thioredoxin
MRVIFLFMLVTLLFSCSGEKKSASTTAVDATKRDGKASAVVRDEEPEVLPKVVFNPPAKGELVTFVVWTSITRKGSKRVKAYYQTVSNGVLMVKNSQGDYKSYKRAEIVPEFHSQFFAKDYQSGKRSGEVVKRVSRRAPSYLKQYFNEEIMRAKGGKANLGSLRGKYVGIYFSAHWCPPCRNFTPKLVSFRNRFKNKFEVIFVSADNSLGERSRYIKEASMPWLVAKYKGQDDGQLSRRFKVSGIPSLVVLDPEGKVVSTSATRAINSSQSRFPW